MGCKPVDEAVHGNRNFIASQGRNARAVDVPVKVQSEFTHFLTEDLDDAVAV